MRRHRLSTRPRLVVAAVLGGLLATGSAAVVEGAAAGAEGPVITVNGVPMPPSGNTLLPGCTMTVAVSGLPAGSHQVKVNVTAMDPTGTGSVLSVEESDISGSFTTGPRNLSATLYENYRKAANGFHLNAAVSIDGSAAGKGKYWLACGAVQHRGHSVQVVFTVDWKGADGVVTTTPPKGLPKRFGLSGSSGQGHGGCGYRSGQLSCQWVVTTEESGTDEAAPVGLRVSGLGTYMVVEQNLPPGWSPELTTVGQFAGSPELRQWTGAEDDEGESALAPAALPAAGGPPTVQHVVVNVLDH